MTPELREQEERLQFDRFDHDDAWALGTLLVGLARERGHAVTIDIRLGDHQLFHYALHGTSADNDDWIERKIRVVRRFGHSSYLVGQTYRDRGTTFEEKSHLDAALYAAHGGCFPIILRGTGPVGTVTVSGLPQLDDHRLVVEALELFLDSKDSDKGSVS
ncbi:heme-degrading domain-containing protein [Micromonospora chersina]|uniref:heme-degrading domain-containing protein n=1 Tax=Micromonospora chersina TaxID=47854 RepID=UPI00371F2718